MKVHIAYFPKWPLHEDAMTVSEEFSNVDYMPRIGETVRLPQSCTSKIHPGNPLPPRRYVIVGIEHFWDSLIAPTVWVGLAPISLVVKE